MEIVPSPVTLLLCFPFLSFKQVVENVPTCWLHDADHRFPRRPPPPPQDERRHVDDGRTVLVKEGERCDLTRPGLLMSLQDESAPADKACKPEAAQATYSTSTVPGSQEVLYINGNGTYSYHSYRGLGGGLLNLNDASSSGESVYSLCFFCASGESRFSKSERRKWIYCDKQEPVAIGWKQDHLIQNICLPARISPCSLAVSESSGTTMQGSNWCFALKKSQLEKEQFFFLTKELHILPPPTCNALFVKNNDPFFSTFKEVFNFENWRHQELSWFDKTQQSL